MLKRPVGEERVLSPGVTSCAAASGPVEFRSRLRAQRRCVHSAVCLQSEAAPRGRGGRAEPASWAPVSRRSGSPQWGLETAPRVQRGWRRRGTFLRFQQERKQAEAPQRAPHSSIGGSGPPASSKPPKAEKSQAQLKPAETPSFSSRLSKQY